MPVRRTVPAHVLAEVAAGGAADAGGLPVALLGDFLDVLVDAVLAGAPLPPSRLRAYRRLGDGAARQGVALRALLDLYLSAAWRLWPHLPPVADAARQPDRVVVAGQVMLHAVDDAVAELTEGYQLARRAVVRAQEPARREFVDDLLTGTGDVAGLVRRAHGFGLDLAGPHAVAVVLAERPIDDASPVLATLQRAVLGGKGDADALLASKQGRPVIVFAAPDRAAVDEVAGRIAKVLDPARRRVGRWRLALGRPGVGPDGVVVSYREALDVLDLVERVPLDAPVLDARELLVYRVLLRDRPALADLVEATLAPLRRSRGGAAPLVETLGAYFGAAGNAARAARELHLSVRATTYRLDRIRALTGLDPARPEDRLTLHVAALGARLLDWS